MSERESAYGVAVKETQRDSEEMTDGIVAVVADVCLEQRQPALVLLDQVRERLWLAARDRDNSGS